MRSTGKSTHSDSHAGTVAANVFRTSVFKHSLIVSLGLVCVALVMSVTMAFAAYGEGEANTVVDTQGNELVVDAPESAADDAELSPVDDCVVTINYYENVYYDDDPDVMVDENGRSLLGTRTLHGFHEGQVLSAWDYVVDIDGFFFWDGWPNKMTVSRDPAQNVYTLIYMKKNNAEYTVNYYLMTGADLTADSWQGALAPEGVEFYKMGSEVFTHQRFDKLVDGSAYEYKLDDMYVIDTYPAQIRLGTDADDNVINVLYTPSQATLPDDLVIEEKPPSHDDEMTTLPDDVIVDDEVPATPVVPSIPDTKLDYDDIITILPDDVLITETVDEVEEPSDGDKVEITDEMLDNPVDKAQAIEVIDAYKTGVQAGSNNPKTNDMILPIILICLAVIVFAFGVLLSVMSVRRVNKMKNDRS